MPKQEDECPICGYDFDEEGNMWSCRHCGLTISKFRHKINYRNRNVNVRIPIKRNKSIHNVRHFNPSSRDDLDIRI